MIEPVRKEVLRLLEQVSESIWEMEDEQLLEAIRQHLADLSKRQTHVA